MDNRVRTLIDREDRRRPLTDDDLATRLEMRRDQVTIARQQLGIPDSRERRRQAVIEAIGRLPDASVSDRELTRILQEQGFEVSRQVVSQCRLEAARLQPPLNTERASSA